MELKWQPSYDHKKWHFLDMFGPAGYRFVNKNGLRVIISIGRFSKGHVTTLDKLLPEGGEEWIHISLSRKDLVPDWKDLSEVRNDFLAPTAYAYIVFPPVDKYVNLHERCLHIYSRLDGLPELPDFHMELAPGLNSI